MLPERQTLTLLLILEQDPRKVGSRLEWKHFMHGPGN